MQESSIQENSSQNDNSEEDSNIDAIAAVVLVISVAAMMIAWVSSH